MPVQLEFDFNVIEKQPQGLEPCVEDSVEWLAFDPYGCNPFDSCYGSAAENAFSFTYASEGYCPLRLFDKKGVFYGEI